MKKYQVKLIKELEGYRDDEFSPLDKADKKKKLLEMARNGEPRPTKRNHKLGKVLGFYTSLKSETYDFVFDKQIREISPDWFVTKSEAASKKKYRLLKMAHNGEPRPSKSHELGSALGSYIGLTSSSYDPIFDKEIRELAPDWFTPQSNRKKKQLLEMARNGEPRPTDRKHKLGRVLINYTSPKAARGKYYDSVFDKQIRELAPDWFITSSDRANKKKQKLLEMAHNGEPRPKDKKPELGVVLSHYTNSTSSSYDPIFDKEIRELAPSWFRHIKRKSNEKVSS